MRVAVLIHIDSNDEEQVHALMIGIFSQTYIKKEVFISLSKTTVSLEVHKIISAARDQSVVPIHLVHVESLGLEKTNAFTVRQALLLHAYEQGFDSFCFAEVGTIWKPTKLSVCIEKISSFRLEHFHEKPKVCVSDFGFHNLRVRRRVSGYCKDIQFELTRFINNTKCGDLQPYPLPPGNLVFDRVAASHVCDQRVSIPVGFEQWVLMVCSLGPTNFHVIKENLFEAEWKIFGSRVSAILNPENQEAIRQKNKNMTVLLEVKRQQLEKRGFRTGSEVLKVQLKKGGMHEVARSAATRLLGHGVPKTPWCDLRFKKCVDFLNGLPI